MYTVRLFETITAQKGGQIKVNYFAR